MDDDDDSNDSQKRRIGLSINEFLYPFLVSLKSIKSLNDVIILIEIILLLCEMSGYFQVGLFFLYFLFQN